MGGVVCGLGLGLRLRLGEEDGVCCGYGYRGLGTSRISNVCIRNTRTLAWRDLIED